MTLTKVYWLFAFTFLSGSLQGMESPQEIYQRPPTEHVITFFIQPCFCSHECVEKSDFSQALDDPGFMNRNHMKYCLKTTRQQGINAVYYGMAAHSDAHGQVTFPRKHIANDVLLVVTEKPTPLISQGVTVNKWMVDPESPAAFYTYTQAMINGEYVWHTQKINIPINHVIPAQAIMIIANPDEVIVHEGSTSTVPGPNIVLPPIYTKRTINLDKDALLFLNINKYFSQVRNVVNYSDDRYANMPQS